MKNPYYERSRLTTWKFRRLARYFVMDLSATNAAALTGLSRKTVTTIFLKMRRRIARECDGDVAQAPDGDALEGATAENGTLFGVLQRKGLIRTQAVAEGTAGTSHSDETPRDYEALIDVRRLKLFRVNGSSRAADAGGAHVSSVESFWSFAKRRLQKFNGVAQHTSYLHVKECEWRFNLRHRDLYAELLKLLRARPL